jgi:hypothetical protein
METIDWINTHTQPSDILVCNRDVIFYLYTGRKQRLSLNFPLLTGHPISPHEPEAADIAQTFDSILGESHGTYLITSSDDFADISDVYQKSISSS